ncbi:MAG: dUTP diphosphatase [bacterium]
MLTRGFMIVSAWKNRGVVLPKRATAHAAGYDIAAAETTVIAAKTVGVVATGLKAYMLPDEVLRVYARSSLPKSRGLMMANAVGIIDADYFDSAENEGHIRVQLYNFTNEAVTIVPGERIVQGIFQKFLTIDDEETVTERRKGGIGSTGK